MSVSIHLCVCLSRSIWENWETGKYAAHLCHAWEPSQHLTHANSTIIVIPDQGKLGQWSPFTDFLAMSNVHWACASCVTLDKYQRPASVTGTMVVHVVAEGLVAAGTSALVRSRQGQAKPPIQKLMRVLPQLANSKMHGEKKMVQDACLLVDISVFYNSA